MRLILQIFLLILGLSVVAQQSDSSRLYLLRKSSQRIIDDFQKPSKLRVELKSGEVLYGHFSVKNDSSIIVKGKTVFFSEIKSINRKLLLPEKYRLFIGPESRKVVRTIAIEKFQEKDDSIKSFRLQQFVPGDRLCIGYDLTKLFSGAFMGYLEFNTRRGAGFSLEYGYKIQMDNVPFKVDMSQYQYAKAVSPAWRFSFGPHYHFRFKGADRSWLLGFNILYKYQNLNDYKYSVYEHDNDHYYITTWSLSRTIWQTGIRIGRPATRKKGMSWFFDFSYRNEYVTVFTVNNDDPFETSRNNFVKSFPYFDFTLIHYWGIKR